MNEDEARKLISTMSHDEKLALYNLLKTMKAQKAA